MNKITISEKFDLFTEEWNLKIIAESNGQLVKIAKGSGELGWHKHDNTDKIFIVFKGHLTLQFKEKNIELGVGEMFVVPKGIEHSPLAQTDTHFMLIEPSSSTDLSSNDVSLEKQEWI